MLNLEQRSKLNLVQHELTWGALGIVLHGLWECVVIRKLYTQMNFEIYEEVWGMIGGGMVSESIKLPSSLSSSNQVPNTTAIQK